jgi:hypothetical protein
VGTDPTLDKAPADGWAEHHQCEVRGLIVSLGSEFWYLNAYDQGRIIGGHVACSERVQTVYSPSTGVSRSLSTPLKAPSNLAVSRHRKDRSELSSTRVQY